MTNDVARRLKLWQRSWRLPQTKPAVGEPLMSTTSREDSTTAFAQDTRSASRPANNAAAMASNTNTAPEEPGCLPMTLTLIQLLRMTPTIWRLSRGANHQGNRNTNDFGRDKASNKGLGDKPIPSRAKVESWRDRETQVDQTERRELRAERGRGGSYRGGRGAHSTYALTPRQPAIHCTSPTASVSRSQAKLFP